MLSIEKIFFCQEGGKEGIGRAGGGGGKGGGGGRKGRRRIQAQLLPFMEYILNVFHSGMPS